MLVGQLSAGHRSLLKDGRGGEATTLTATNRKEPIQIGSCCSCNSSSMHAVIDHPLPPACHRCACDLPVTPWLHTGAWFSFSVSFQGLSCKLSIRAVWKKIAGCVCACVFTVAKRETLMGLFVILEILFVPGACAFQSRPPQRKQRKTLSFLRHLSVPFNFRKCIPSSGQLKHPTALGPFLPRSHHSVPFPSPTESQFQQHPQSFIT